MPNWDENEVDETPQYTQEERDEIFQKIIRFLIDGGNIEEARVLLSCNVEITIDYRSWRDDYDRPRWSFYGHTIEIRAQRNAYTLLKDMGSINRGGSLLDLNGTSMSIQDAFIAFLDGPNIYNIRGDAQVDTSPGWRERLHDLVESGGIEASNQGLGAERSDYFKLWNNLKFRSVTEQRVAEELDKRAIMFFPNCTARLGMRNDRKNKEPDFLICYKGKWGILEVDGPHHSGRADIDHERDRLFKQHGIVVVEHFNHEECYNNPGQVVAKFLGLLENAK